MSNLRYDRSGNVTGWPEPEIINATSRETDCFDAMQAAYKAEYDRWDWRAREKKRGSPYEIVRNSSPNNDIIDDTYFEIIMLTKRECENIAQAENWLEAYRGRAAMRAALGCKRR